MKGEITAKHEDQRTPKAQSG